jgi:hypothetical protein
MSRWIDITNDVSKKYYNAFMKRVEMPEYVKSANVLTAEEASNMNSNSFADSVNRNFPINTKANCWCSAVYFYGNQYNKDLTSKQAEVNIHKAAEIWDIADEVAKIKAAFEIQTIPVTYAMSFTHKGAAVNRCPDHTKEAATTSVQWLYDNRFNFPIGAQKAAATRLAGKADVLKLHPAAATYMDKLANSEAYGNLNCKVATAITDRLNAIPAKKWGEVENELLKLANEMASNPLEVCQNGEIISAALETLDIKHGFTQKWGSAYQHPIDCCFRVNMLKVAADTDSIVHLTTGTPVDLNRISNSQLEKGLKIAGDDFLSYCQTDGLNVDRSKAAEILPTLPKPEAHRFETAIKSAGYRPESGFDLADRLFKESNDLNPAIGALQNAMPQQDRDVPQPQNGEDETSFEMRMQQMKEQAKIDSLDAQAGLAAVKARKAKQEIQQKTMEPSMGSDMNMGEMQ